MKTRLHILTIVCALAVTGIAQAEHKSSCKNVHGKVTVVTDDSVTVNDKLYKIGDDTRITKDGEKVKSSQLKAGDIVCLDKRGKGVGDDFLSGGSGKDDVDGQIAAISVLTAEEGSVVTKEKSKETTKEKTSERVKEKTSE